MKPLYCRICQQPLDLSERRKNGTDRNGYTHYLNIHTTCYNTRQRKRYAETKVVQPRQRKPTTKAKAFQQRLERIQK